MKKYITPICRTIELDINELIARSPNANDEQGDASATGLWLVKEEKPAHNSLWDEEW